jgi:hypothetical protein
LKGEENDRYKPIPYPCLLMFDSEEHVFLNKKRAMTETFKIVLTAVCGVAVFVIGQLVAKFLIDPLQEQKRLIGEIAASIILYSNVGSGIESHYYNQIRLLGQSDDPSKDINIDRYKELINAEWARSDEAAKVLRRQATELLSKTNAIPCYRLLSYLRQVPPLDDIVAASSELIGMSNATHGHTTYSSRIETVIRRLNLKSVAKQQGLLK